MNDPDVIASGEGAASREEAGTPSSAEGMPQQAGAGFAGNPGGSSTAAAIRPNAAAASAADEPAAGPAGLQAPAGYDPLALDNQLCFPLYAASKEVTRRYKPFLDPLGLTYTQYVAMMALWERDGITVSELGKRLYLDSATLTPLLKRLEARGYVRRTRSREDERAVIVTLTDEGRALRERARDVPRCMASCMNLPLDDMIELKRLLEKLLRVMGK